MMNKKERIISIGIALIASFFLISAIISYDSMDFVEKRATMHIVEEQPNEQQGRDILAAEAENEKQIPAVFYQVKRQVEVSGVEFEKMASCEVTYLCGDVTILLDGLGNLTDDDKSGCLISEGLAKKLFGSIKVIGKELSIPKRKLVVRGIFKGDKEQVLCLADATQVFDRVGIKVLDKRLASSELQKFCTRHGLSGDVVEWNIFRGIAKTMILLATIWILVNLWQPSDKKIKIAYGILIVIIICLQIHIPKEMVPAKFSDFGFWSEWGIRGRRFLNNLLYLEKTGYEIFALRMGVKSIISANIAILCGVFLGRTNRGRHIF